MPLPAWVHEWVVAPVAFLLAFDHARRAVGLPRALGELLALVLYGQALELVAIAVFASHTYGTAWTIAPGGVPLAVALVWAALILSGLSLAGRAVRGPVGRAAWAALFGITLDLMIEPAAVRSGLWTWTPAGPWLDVPVGNFVGWAVIVGVYAWGAERAGGRDQARPWETARVAAGRTVLAAVSIGALVLVGLLWRGLALEGLFTGSGGWVVCASVMAAALLVPVTSPPDGAPRRTLADRLAAPPPWRPLAVFLLVGSVFAIDAVATGHPEVALVAVGSLAAMARLVASVAAAREPAPAREVVDGAA